VRKNTSDSNSVKSCRRLLTEVNSSVKNKTGKEGLWGKRNKEIQQADPLQVLYVPKKIAVPSVALTDFLTISEVLRFREVCSILTLINKIYGLF